MRMRTGIMAVAITVVLLMATVQTVAGAAVLSNGKIYFENGTRADRADGWYVEIQNLDQDYGSDEPWTVYTAWNPGPYDWGRTCEYNSGSDRFQVDVTSPAGWTTVYTGVNISVYDDIEYDVAMIAQDVTVYEVIPETDTFTKSLPIGWNLISLPLTPLDSSTGAVLGNDTIAYDAVKQYDATTKTFADATTMAPGTGYFVHVTTAGDWVYEGTPETSTSPGLKAGLNMIGVPNCTKTVSAAMGTADYRYVARWDAVDQKYEVYNPNAPAASFYGFTEMTAGEGYFVSAKSDDVDWTVSCP
jgi:hypothetical protein